MFLGSILLENNRWKDRLNPLFKLDQAWGARIAAAGFSGIELWDPHHFAASPEERAGLARCPCPIRIFNSYITLADENPQAEAGLVEAARFYSKTLAGIKFNFGKDRSTLDAEIAALDRIAAQLPENVKLLCECHPGTSVEEPEAAGEVFRRLPRERFGAIVHPFTTPRLEDWFALLGDRIEHLHLQARGQDQTWLAPRPGNRGVDEGLEVLARHRFGGSATLEFTRGITAGLGQDELFEQACGDLAALGPRLPHRP